jgi:hypothetical protein
MSFNAIGAFVKAKSFRLNTRITSIFHRLRVNHDESRPLWFFLTCSRDLLCNCVMIRSRSVSDRRIEDTIFAQLLIMPEYS